MPAIGAGRVQSVGWVAAVKPGVTPWTTTGSPRLSKFHSHSAWGAALGHLVLSVGVWTLTQPWLIGWPKLLCHQAPCNASLPSKYWVQGTCLMSYQSGAKGPSGLFISSSALRSQM